MNTTSATIVLRTALVLLALHLVGGPALAAAVGPLPSNGTSPLTVNLSLRQALDLAVNNNPNVLISKERIEAARAQTLTQLGALLPNVSSNVRQSQQTLFLGTIGLSPVKTRPFSIFDTRVNASQSLFSLSLIQRWRASRESLRAVEFESDVSKFDTMANVALLYMDGLKAAAVVKMHEANQQMIGDLLSLVKQRQKGGLATALDAARMEAQLANERQQVTASSYEREHALLALVNQLALPPGVRLSLTDDMRHEVLDLPTPEHALEDALASRPEVQAQMKRVRAAELTYQSTTGERIPALVAQGDYGLIGNRWSNTLQTYNGAVMLQIPIFDGAQREGRISEMRSQLRQEALRMRVVLNQVTLEVNDALAALTSAREQLATAREGLQAAMKELDLARERYTVLTAATQFEVTNAILDVARARENAVNALYQLNAARVNYARATGTLQSLNNERPAP